MVLDYHKNSHTFRTEKKSIIYLNHTPNDSIKTGA